MNHVDKVGLERMACRSGEPVVPGLVVDELSNLQVCHLNSPSNSRLTSQLHIFVAYRPEQLVSWVARLIMRNSIQLKHHDGSLWARQECYRASDFMRTQWMSLLMCRTRSTMYQASSP